MPSTATSILDGLSTSVAVKAPCRTVATSNISLSGLQTISGYTTVEGDRVLVKGQTDAVTNGIYIASTGSWTRAKDADGNRDLVQGTRVIIRSTTADGVEYELTTANPIVIGTTSQTWTLRYGANATYDQTDAEVAATVTPVNYAVDTTEYGDIRRYGTNSIPGTTDMTAAIQAAYDTGVGTIKIPYGLVRVTSGFTFTRSVNIIGLGNPPGGVGNENHPFSTILKDFSGDLFTFTGSDGATDGSGGGVENLRLVQNSGSSITANGAGTAIKLTGASTSSRPSWVKIRNVIIEYATGKDSWTWGIDVDGTAITGNVIPDLWISDVSTHTASSNGGALRLLAASAKITNCGFYDAQANVLVSGISGTPSSGVHFTGVGISGTLTLDWANDVSFEGGVVTTIVNTANVGGAGGIMRPSIIVNPFTSANNLAGRFFGLIRYSTQQFATLVGSWRFSQSIALENAQHLHGLNAAGTAAPRLIGMNATDEVEIARDGSGILLTGATKIASTMRFSGTPQTLTGAGAVNLTTAITLLVTTGANALTLADGAEGQEKYIVMKTDGGAGTLTPTNLYNGSTITFDDVGDSAHLLFVDGQWTFMGGTATLA